MEYKITELLLLIQTEDSQQRAVKRNSSFKNVKAMCKKASITSKSPAFKSSEIFSTSVLQVFQVKELVMQNVCYYTCILRSSYQIIVC